MAQISTSDVSGLSYEQARGELVQIVSRIEGGQTPLEESMQLWERGEALAAHCQAKLDAAQAQLDAGAPRADSPSPDAPAREDAGAPRADSPSPDAPAREDVGAQTVAEDDEDDA